MITGINVNIKTHKNYNIKMNSLIILVENVLESERPAFNSDNISMMKQSVNNSVGNNRFSKNFIPLGKINVCGNDSSEFFITVINYLKEKFGIILRN